MSASPSAPSPHPESHTAREFLSTVCDPQSFQSWDKAPQYGEISSAYQATLEKAAAKSGCDEAVITGCAHIAGTKVALIVGEFNFLGGSIGAATARRIIAAIHRATTQELPLLVAPASGGTRMQEGTPAFVFMASITAAIYRHKEAHLPYIVYLRHPTTGGVLASWGSAGHITLAQPEALIGFLGPRVVELTTGTSIPEHVQRAENLQLQGLIDAIFTPKQLREELSKIFRILNSTPLGPTALPQGASAIDAWEAITATRDPQRPSTGDLLAWVERSGIGQVWELRGSGEGRTSAALRVALLQLHGQSCVVIGQDRAQQPPQGEHWLDTAALRCARRGIALAEQLQLPLLSLIDTPGAELSRDAEESGLAASIAKTLHDLLTANTATISVLIGQGCGGGALAMVPADIVLGTSNSWLSPLPPEGASAILYRDTGHAPALMRQQQVSAHALYENGLLHGVIPEHSDAEQYCAQFWEAVAAGMSMLPEPRSLSDSHATRLARYEQLATQNAPTPD